jgi:hypothetical protein
MSIFRYEAVRDEHRADMVQTARRPLPKADRRVAASTSAGPMTITAVAAERTIVHHLNTASPHDDPVGPPVTCLAPDAPGDMSGMIEENETRHRTHRLSVERPIRRGADQDRASGRLSSHTALRQPMHAMVGGIRLRTKRPRTPDRALLARMLRADSARVLSAGERIQ